MATTARCRWRRSGQPTARRQTPFRFRHQLSRVASELAENRRSRSPVRGVPCTPALSRAGWERYEKTGVGNEWDIAQQRKEASPGDSGTEQHSGMGVQPTAPLESKWSRRLQAPILASCLSIQLVSLVTAMHESIANANAYSLDVSADWRG